MYFTSYPCGQCVSYLKTRTYECESCWCMENVFCEWIGSSKNFLIIVDSSLIDVFNFLASDYLFTWIQSRYAGWKVKRERASKKEGSEKCRSWNVPVFGGRKTRNSFTEQWIFTRTQRKWRLYENFGEGYLDTFTFWF